MDYCRIADVRLGTIGMDVKIAIFLLSAEGIYGRA